MRRSLYPRHHRRSRLPEVVLTSNQYTEWGEKIAIIGAGPAGLSAANYLATKGYKPTVFEKHDEPGGMMVYGIPSYKLQKDVVAAEIDVIRELGVEIRCGVEVGKDVTIQEIRATRHSTSPSAARAPVKPASKVRMRKASSPQLTTFTMSTLLATR